MKKKIVFAVTSLALSFFAFGVNNLPCTMAMTSDCASDVSEDVTQKMNAVMKILRDSKNEKVDKSGETERSLIIFKPDVFMNVKQFQGADGKVDWSKFDGWNSNENLWRKDCESSVKFVIDEFKKNGLTIENFSDFVQLDREIVEKHYDEHKEKKFFKDLVAYITSGPVIVATVRGKNAINKIRSLIKDVRGTIAPYEGELKRQCNGLHASDKKDSAEREIENLGSYLVH